MSNLSEAQIVKLIEGTAGVRKRVQASSRLVDDLGFDSIMMVELMSAVEDAFNLIITLDAATRIETVADLHQTVIAAMHARVQPEEVSHVAT